MGLDPISIATDGYACSDGQGPRGITIATQGYVCYRIFQQAVSGIITMFGTLGALFIAGGASDAQKNQGGTAITIDIGVD